ncbi:MAG: NfeD family protein [Ignavibacteriales bacterium]
MNYIWFGIVVLLSLIEIITLDLVALWFIISGIIVIFISFYIESFLIQFIIFVLIGLIPFIFLRPYVKQFLVRTKVKNNIKYLINKTGIVTKEVNDKEGEIEISKNFWPVVASKKITVGSKVKVDSIKNFTIYVSLVETKKDNKKKK